jgi:phage-related minor tail protein
MSTIADLNVKLTADTQAALSGLSGFDKKLTDMSKQAQKVGDAMTKYATVPIMAGFGAMFLSASNFNETLNKVDTTFGDLAPSVVAWGDTTLEQFGIAKGTALDMIALFGDMGTSMGIPQDEMQNMGQTLVGLAGDLASFKNVKIEVAENALKGIFTGETESLKQLGIIMTESTLQQYALSKGMQKTYSEMTQAEKVALRYQFVMDSTKNAQGDFERTSDGSANQMRILSESIKETATIFGEILIPAITPVLQALNDFFGWLKSLDEGTRGWIIALMAMVAAVGPVLSMTAKFITIFNTLKTATAAQTVAQGTLNATTAAFPLVWIIAAVIAVIAVFWLIWSNWDKISEFLSKSWEWLKESFSNLWNGIVESVSNMVKSVTDWFGKMFKGFVDFFVKFNIFSLINDYIIKPFFKIDLFEIGVNVIQGFIDGVSSLFRNIGKFFLDLLPGWIVGPFKWALGIKSPSKVFAGFGENIGAGLVNGMEDSLSMVEQASVDMAGVSVGGFSGLSMDVPDVSVENQQAPINLALEVVLGSQHIRVLAEDINKESRRVGRNLIEV